MDPNPQQPQQSNPLAMAQLSLSLSQFPQSKSLAELAISQSLPPSDQFLADQILTISLVLIAASSTPIDYYSVLNLGTHDRNVFNQDSLFFAYRSLAGLLDPELNKFPHAVKAFELVKEAYEVLSDPVKRLSFDDEIRNASNAAPPSLAPSFWTLCRGCYCVHEYEREHVGKTLTCGVCRRVFVAEELPEAPEVVEGTNMYYCTWAFFPVGFVGGYRFHWDLEEEVEEEEEVEVEVKGTPPSETERPGERKMARPVGGFGARMEHCDEGDEEEEGSDG